MTKNSEISTQMNMRTFFFFTACSMRWEGGVRGRARGGVHLLGIKSGLRLKALELRRCVVRARGAHPVKLHVQHRYWQLG